MASTRNMTMWTLDNGVTESTYTYIFEDYTQRVILSVILAAVCFVGIPGNILVILAVTLSRRLRSPTYWFVVNLAATDFITCAFVPFHIVALLSRQGWPLPDWLCTASGGISFTCVASSTTSLALIAFNRWCLLTKPLASFQKMFAPRKILLIVACAWLYSVLVAALPFLAGVDKLNYNYTYKACSIVNNAAGAILGLGMFFLPAVPIVTFYILIYRFVRQHMIRMAAHDVNMTVTRLDDDMASVPSSSVVSMVTVQCDSSSAIQTSSTPSPTRRHPSTKRPSINREQVTVTKRMALIVCVFLACFLPIMICSLVPNDFSDLAVPWAEVLVVINSCLNPVIYAGTIPAFRDVMGCILRCRFGSIPEPIGFIRRHRAK